MSFDASYLQDIINYGEESSFLHEIITCTTALIVTLNKDGLIVKASSNDALYFGTPVEGWIGKHIKHVTSHDSLVKIDRILEHFEHQAHSGALALPQIEINHINDKNEEFSIRYIAMKIAQQKQIILLGQDMSEIIELQQRIIHNHRELQIERDMQLRRKRASMRMREKSGDSRLVLSLKEGYILDATERVSKIFGQSAQELIDQNFFALFPQKTSTLLKNELSHNAHEMRFDLLLPYHSEQSLHFQAEKFGSNAHSYLICDIHTVEEQSHIENDAHHSPFFHQNADAFVIIDASGHILDANQQFIQLCDIETSPPYDALLIENYITKSNSEFRALIKMVEKNKSIINYDTTLNPLTALNTPIQLSIFQFTLLNNIFFGITIRGKFANLVNNHAQFEGQPCESFVKKIPLREIINRSTAVVEKKCIQEALNITKNNRLAAAEILGISRQSLYVKLRTYEII